MILATAIIFALDPLETSSLAARELCIVGVAHVGPVHCQIDTVVPDEALLFLLVGGSELAALSIV